MDFFGHQEQARRATRRLITLYIIAVLAIIGLLYLVLWWFARGVTVAKPELGAWGGWLHWDLLLAVAAGVLIVVGFGSLFKVSQLRSGGSVVAAMLGGRYVQPNTKDPLERQLLNVVEEMSIASGTAVPSVFVMKREEGINAFAAGWSPDDAAVAVTRGALEQLTRDELQGVIAHEFSHVFHGDMRLNIRMLGVLHGITCIAIGGSVLLRVGALGGNSRNRRENGAPVLALAIAMLAVGYLGVFFARLIKASVSRQREFLADASAVQYTRNPTGLAQALRRIGQQGSQVHHGRAEDASHMFFANALGSMWLKMFATHPPLDERINRLDRNARVPQQKGPAATAAAAAAAAAEQAQAGLKTDSPIPDVSLPGVDLPGNLPGGLGAVLAGAGAGGPRNRARHDGAVEVSPDALVDTVGEPQMEHVARARAILAAIPAALREAVRDSYSARAVLCALLLDDDDAVREHQLAAVKEHLDDATRTATEHLHQAVRELPTATRLPLVELAMPGLRNSSQDQFADLDRTLIALAQADDHITPFEMALHKLVRKHLGGHFDPRPGSRPAFRKIDEVIDPIRCLLSVIARAGQDDGEAQQALDSAEPVLRHKLQLAPIATCGLDEVDDALGRLARSSGSIKRSLLLAAARVAARDGLLSIEEGELIRAFAEALDCPMPPILAAEAEV